MTSTRHTFCLFARPSFWEGFARPIDLGTTMQDYNDAPTPETADSMAIRSDWLATGDDLRAAMTAYDPEKSRRAKA